MKRSVGRPSPRSEVTNSEVKRFLADHGYQTVRDVCLQCSSWTGIAQVGEAIDRQVQAAGEALRDAEDELVQTLGAQPQSDAYARWQQARPPASA